MNRMDPHVDSYDLAAGCLCASTGDDGLIVPDVAAAEDDDSGEAPSSDPDAMKSRQRFTYHIVEAARNEIITKLSAAPPEDGLALFGLKTSDRIITHAIHDPDAEKTPVSFKPRAEAHNQWLKRLNAVFAEVGVDGLDFKGIVHSHPPGINFPSYGDLEFVKATLSRSKNIGATNFFMPIFCRGRLYPYVVTYPDLSVRVATLKVI